MDRSETCPAIIDPITGRITRSYQTTDIIATSRRQRLAIDMVDWT